MRSSKPPPGMSSPHTAFVPVVGLAKPGGQGSREPAREGRRKAERSFVAREQHAGVSHPAPSVMNALVAAWLADVAGQPRILPAKDERAWWGVFGFALHVFRRSEGPPAARAGGAAARTGTRRDGRPRRDRADDEADEVDKTSPLYRSLYFAATHSRSPSARALARQMCSQRPAAPPECARNAALLSQRGKNVPSFLLADDSPAGQGLLEEMREAWRNNLNLNGRESKPSLGKVLGTSLSFVMFVLNPFN